MALEIKDEVEFSALLITHKEQILLLRAISEQTGIITKQELVQEYLIQTLPTLPRKNKSYYVRLNHRAQRKKQLTRLYDHHLVVI